MTAPPSAVWKLATYLLTMSSKILFVCTGNTCRSPMCAAAARAKYGLDADSRGLAADGSTISANAVLALREAGIPADENRLSRPLTERDLADAEMIFTVTPSHAVLIREHLPAYADKVRPMPLPISDPYGGDLNRYRLCLGDILTALELLFGGNHEDS